jgi:hypothetical protein
MLLLHQEVKFLLDRMQQVDYLHVAVVDHVLNKVLSLPLLKVGKC